MGIQKMIQLSMADLSNPTFATSFKLAQLGVRHRVLKCHITDTQYRKITAGLNLNETTQRKTKLQPPRTIIQTKYDLVHLALNTYLKFNDDNGISLTAVHTTHELLSRENFDVSADDIATTCYEYHVASGHLEYETANVTMTVDKCCNCNSTVLRYLEAPESCPFCSSILNG